MKNRMFASICVFLIALDVLVLGFAVRKQVHAQEPPKHWVLWKDCCIELIKIQDGDCSLYLVTGDRRGAVATGQGCK